MHLNRIECRTSDTANQLAQIHPAWDSLSGNVSRLARSRHPGGVNAVMCDGSVQYVVDDVDLTVWRAASTTHGEEVYQGLTP